MRTVLAFALVALSLRASAQQSMLDPAISNQTLCVETLELLPGGDIVSVGFVGDQAHMCRTTLTGNLVWSRTCSLNSAFYGSTIAPNTEMIAVGYEYASGLISSFTSGGATAWSKTLTPAGDTIITFRAVDTDASGNSYVVGDKYRFPQRREILVKLDVGGNVIFQRELQSPSNKYFAEKVFVKNNALYVFGEGMFNTRGISLAKYSLAGALQGYTIFGGFGGALNPDIFLDAVETPTGFVFSYENGNAPGTMLLARVDENLSIVGTPRPIQYGLSDFWSLYLGALAVSQDGGIYVSGSMAGNSANYSFVLKVSGDLSTPVWGRRIPISVPINDLVKTQVRETAGGTVVFAQTQNTTFLGSNTGATLTHLSGAGNAIGSNYCFLPTAFSFQMWTDWLTTNPVSRTPQGIALAPGSATFGPYVPRATPCGSTLPVEMLSFTGKQIDRTVELRWVTASEHNNDRFEVMRSPLLEQDAWEKIGEIEGAGNSLVPIDYDFVDLSPLEGTSYYQLRQVDEDGTEHYSTTVAVDFVLVASPTLVLYPNPIQSGQTLGGTDGQAFEVTNSLGQVVFRSTGPETTLPDLGMGTYIVKITATGAFGRVVVND